jgi:hypothetical protein
MKVVIQPELENRHLLVDILGNDASTYVNNCEVGFWVILVKSWYEIGRF